MSALAGLTAEEFNSFVKETPTALVEFGAPWCGPCRQLDPILAELDQANPAVAVRKVDIDQSPDLAAKFDLMGIPAVFFFRDGQVVHEIRGSVPPKRLLQLKIQELFG